MQDIRTQSVDKKEFELPDTHLISDIENQVFQSIVLKALSQIQGIGLLEGTLVDDLLGREEVARVKGVAVDQDFRNSSVNIRVEVNVAYGVCLPAKAEEIQTRILEEVTRLTGLHVGSVHVVFKNLLAEGKERADYPVAGLTSALSLEQDYVDDF